MTAPIRREMTIPHTDFRRLFERKFGQFIQTRQPGSCVLDYHGCEITITLTGERIHRIASMELTVIGVDIEANNSDECRMEQFLGCCLEAGK